MRALISHHAASHLALLLKSDGWITDTAEADDIAAYLDASRFDVLVVADAEQVRLLRRAGVKVAALVWATLPSASRVHAFTICGVDAIIDDLAPRDEIVATIAALARRAAGVASTALTYGPLTVDLAAKIVRANGEVVHLTRHEWNLFEALVVRDRVQSKEDLMGALYSASADDEPEIKIIDVFICKLRKKLREAGGGTPIVTAWGRGYRFDRGLAA